MHAIRHVRHPFWALPTSLPLLVCALAFASVVFVGCGGNQACTDCVDAATTVDAAIDAQFVPAEITDFLDTIDGLTFSEQPSLYAGYRRFVITFTQPLDHNTPGSKTFEQRFILHHRDRAAPLVLHTSGYYLFSGDRLAELSQAMNSNQIDVEQRFFSPSSPTPTVVADWDFVSIEQAANDHHRIVTAMKPYYNGKWLSTGHSKGGMTSVYHRRFFPDDVDATVPYVAPISFAAGDTRYHTFFDQVATAECRAALHEVQRTMLTRRAPMLTQLQADIAGTGKTFIRSGGIEAALEASIVELPWSFFQAGNAANCSVIPGPAATDDQLYNYLSNTVGVSSDAELEFFSTYYYQAEAELGYPDIPIAHLEDLLQFTNVVGDYLPAGVSATYDPTAMADVDQWVKSSGSELLFIYGEFDPWYGGGFELGAGTQDSFKLIVAGANHRARIRSLSAADQTIALDAIERWMGVRPALFQARFVELSPFPTPPLRYRR